MRPLNLQIFSTLVCLWTYTMYFNRSFLTFAMYFILLFDFDTAKIVRLELIKTIQRVFVSFILIN